MTLITSAALPDTDLPVDAEPAPSASAVPESLPDQLSPGVVALVGIAALALAVVCTTLLLTFSTTTLDPLTAPALLSVLPTGL